MPVLADKFCHLVFIDKYLTPIGKNGKIVCWSGKKRFLAVLWNHHLQTIFCTITTDQLAKSIFTRQNVNSLFLGKIIPSMLACQYSHLVLMSKCQRQKWMVMVCCTKFQSNLDHFCHTILATGKIYFLPAKYQHWILSYVVIVMVTMPTTHFLPFHCTVTILCIQCKYLNHILFYSFGGWLNGL